MTEFRLEYKRQAVEDIKKLTPHGQRRLKQKLEFLITQPNPLAFSVRLTKPADAQFRFRVGDFRILFDVEDSGLVTLHIQHRREVYRR